MKNLSQAAKDGDPIAQLLNFYQFNVELNKEAMATYLKKQPANIKFGKDVTSINKARNEKEN